jgi:HD-GYP domain-containing protein (c-di-GMP phosphodiesterase class II)
MAVADVFTSLTENRPYRKAMNREDATRVLTGMSARRELDESLVTLSLGRFEDIDRFRAIAQAKAIREYGEFRAALG